MKVQQLCHIAKGLTVIASEAKQSRVSAVDSGLLRRLRLLAMTRHIKDFFGQDHVSAPK
jgi:hypothetical protein